MRLCVAIYGCQCSELLPRNSHDAASLRRLRKSSPRASKTALHFLSVSTLIMVCQALIQSNGDCFPPNRLTSLRAPLRHRKVYTDLVRDPTCTCVLLFPHMYRLLWSSKFVLCARWSRATCVLAHAALSYIQRYFGLP